MRRHVLAGLLLVAAAMFVAGPVLALNQFVALRDTRYNPKKITIHENDTVYWTHTDGSDVQHSVTSVAGQAESFDSSPNCPPTCMTHGDNFTHTFRHAGTFTYFCRVHCPNNSCAADGMRGTIVVAAVATPKPPAPTPQPAPGAASASVSVTTPVPPPTPTISPTPVPTPAYRHGVVGSSSPATSPLAAAKTTNTDTRGLAIGLGIAAAALAAAGSVLLLIRFRRSK